MKHTIYFTDKEVTFTSTPPQNTADHTGILTAQNASGEILCAKVLKMLETYNTIYIISDNSDLCFEEFKRGFTVVDAAGGVVVNHRGEWLMMERRGRWDLPKGHVEPNESVEQTAVREIEEETGVRAVIEELLCTTWHAYYFKPTQRWELKHTFWYRLAEARHTELKPQIEEEIVHVEWASEAQVQAHLKNTYPTIVCVVQAMRSKA